MKVTLNKKFTPIELHITIESINELEELLARLSVGSRLITETGGCSGYPFNNIGNNMSLLFNTCDNLYENLNK